MRSVTQIVTPRFADASRGGSVTESTPVTVSRNKSQQD